MRCKPAGHRIKIPEYLLDKVYLPKNMLVRFYSSTDNISSLDSVGFCCCIVFTFERVHMLKYKFYVLLALSRVVHGVRS